MRAQHVAEVLSLRHQPGRPAHRALRELLGECRRKETIMHAGPDAAQLLRPSQRPRVATASAILRVASSIISPSKRTAPRPSPSVASRYALRMPSARAYVAGSGEYTRFTTSISAGCITHLPSKPSAAAFRPDS